VYIGKHEYPLKPVQDSDNDTAHLNETADKIIRFGHSTSGHEYVVDQILTNKQGVTFEVFKDKVVEEPVEDEEGKKVSFEIDLNPPHILIKEVVREPKMHYYRVPKLGSYLAIRLEYGSCLSVESLEAGIDNMQDVMKQRD